MDYTNLKEVIIHNQQEMDSIPDDFQGRIILRETTERVCINKCYNLSVVAYGNSNVATYGNSNVATYGNSNVVAWENSSVEAWGNSRVEAFGNSSVEAFGNSHVVAYGNSNILASGNSNILAYGNSNILASGNSNVVAYRNSRVEAWENSRVEAWENSSVEAFGNSRVEAFGNSRVEVWENSSVVAGGNVQVVDRTYDHQIKVGANARIVYMPHGLQEFINFYGIKVEDGVGTFYKAVRKTPEGLYRSDHDYNFFYEIGKKKEETKINRDTSEDCGTGIHISTMQFALNYGESWNNLAIIECTSKLEDIVCPDNTEGEVRTSKVMVVREVPLEECGIYGKILLKQRK